MEIVVALVALVVSVGSAGVTTFIYMGCDALNVVRNTLAGFGADLASN